MRKIVLYNPRGQLQYIEQILKSEGWEKQCSMSIFDREEHLLYYLEEVNEDVDILIFYVDLKTGNGLELAGMCKRKIRQMKLLLIAESPICTDVFSEVHPEGLILLPVSKKRFLQVLDYLKWLSDQKYQQCVTLVTKGKIYRIPYQEILYVESDGHQMILQTWEDEIRIYGKLDDLQSELPVYFRRCHKSYLVNMNYVRRLEMYRLKICGKEEWIPVSQKYYREMRERVELFGKEMIKNENYQNKIQDLQK